MGGGQCGLPMWGKFARDGAAGGGRLGRGSGTGSLVAPPWLKLCADAWVWKWRWLPDGKHEHDPKKNLTQREKINQSCHNTETQKLLIQEKCLKHSISNYTFRWQNGLRAHIKYMPNKKFNCEQYQWSFRFFEKLKNTLITFIKKIFTSLKYYKNLSVLSGIGVL